MTATGARAPVQMSRGSASPKVNFATVIAAALLLSIIVLALAAPWIAQDPYAQSLIRRRIPPIWHAWLWDVPRATWTHPLGTDRLGRDYLARILHGARVSLSIGLSAALISGAIGTTLGLLAGYHRGKVDAVVSFFLTTRLSLPVILVALTAAALFGSSLTVVIWVIGLLLWDRFAVVVRSATLQQRALDYVTAARLAGRSDVGILTREILPNIMPALLVVATLEAANAILLEAALSFLGMGVQAPTASWGLMLAEAKEDIFSNPWMIAIPGLALFVLVFCVNTLGDAVAGAGRGGNH